MTKIHSINYVNTLILVADDTKATEAKMPPVKDGKTTVANLQFDMIYNAPYQYNSDEVIFDVYATKQGLSKKE